MDPDLKKKKSKMSYCERFATAIVVSKMSDRFIDEYNTQLDLETRANKLLAFASIYYSMAVIRARAAADEAGIEGPLTLDAVYENFSKASEACSEREEKRNVGLSNFHALINEEWDSSAAIFSSFKKMEKAHVEARMAFVSFVGAAIDVYPSHLDGARDLVKDLKQEAMRSVIGIKNTPLLAAPSPGAGTV